ncbi:MAG TPA: GTP-binding protein [Dysgonamonadaceae bacterium]|nr:GTP-binding protein [Dysgonamonadaceae bacterium]
MNTLKFITAGNVDDGKSTLIGRLLYDSDSIHTDQLGILEKHKKREGGKVDLSLITDGLRAEREQGITIDVAYKYFSTLKRKFIIADAPGHEQYTRNMITGASNSDLIILMVDARKGITVQTKRHASIGSLMGIKKAIVAVNKIDMVGYSQEIFDRITGDFEKLKNDLNYDEIIYIPVSALLGDNVVEKSEKTKWFAGKPLLSTLETISIESAESLDSRFQVQWVIRPKNDTHHDYRGYAGQILSGKYQVGDVVKILPSGNVTTISTIEKNQQGVEVGSAGDNVVIHLADNIDVSRGDHIIKIGHEPYESYNHKAWICWLDNNDLNPEKTYLLQHRFSTVRVKIQSVEQKWDVNNWNFTGAEQIKQNDIAKVSLRTNNRLFYDSFEKNIRTGNAILIDETSYNTVAALMFLN